jgi:uncharacterized protein with NAD-binding domain and iron-sulfur cluster
VWLVDGEGGADDGAGGSYQADFGVLAIDLPGVQKVLPKSLVLDEDCAGITLLRTTSVMVLRLNFRTAAAQSRWSGPDSGVFAADDLLDNFFALHTFQREFAARSELVLECHIGDSERLASLDDASIYGESLRVLDRYFPSEELSARFDPAQSRLLRHDDVFSLFAPGDLARTPHVSSPRRPNLMFAGDWVRTDEPAHRSFFMERAAVTGIEAANAILRRKGLAEKQRSIRSPTPPPIARWLSLPTRLRAGLRASLRRLLALD